MKADERVQPLLQRFRQVLIGDSTTIPLCDALAEEFPGCGGSHGSGKAAAKWQVIWDCVSGALWKMSWEAGQQRDAKSEILDETPPPGSLSIFDLGYFSLDRFRRWPEAGTHWISRGISDLTVTVEGVTHDLHDWLKAQVGGPIDQWVEVGAARLRCRIVALLAPAEVAARRCQKARDKAAKKGRQPTARHLATCDWTVFLTSCPADLLTWKEVVVLYRLRWQIELLFKLWKSHNLLEAHRTERSRATTGRAVFADDGGGDSTLAAPHHVLVRSLAEPDQSRALDPPRTLAIDPPRATTPRTHRAAHPLANPLPRPSPTRQKKNQTLQPPTHRNP